MTIVKYNGNHYHVEEEHENKYELQLVHRTLKSDGKTLYNLDYKKDEPKPVSKEETQRISDEEEGGIISQLYEQLIKRAKEKAGYFG